MSGGGPRRPTAAHESRSPARATRGPARPSSPPVPSRPSRPRRSASRPHASGSSLRSPPPASSPSRPARSAPTRGGSPARARSSGGGRRARGRLFRPGDPRYRALGLLLALGLLFGLVVVRLGYIQVVSAERYVAYGEEQRIKPIALPAARGTIFDRNGKDLALSTPAKAIGADPSVVADPAGAARQLAQVLGLHERDVAAQLADDGRFVYLARQVDAAVADRVADLDVPGVLILDESARLTPAGDLARSLLGTVDLDNVGISGLERLYDGQLAGEPGEYVVERDLEGRTIPAGRHLTDPAVPGDDLMLTIDRSLQYDTEKLLAEQVVASGAKAGYAIVSDPTSGEILALANVEADPATQVVGNTGNNLAVTSMYEPGSVNKMITLAAALEEGLVERDTIVPVPDSLRVADRTFHESHELPPALSVTEIMAESSNIGTIKIAQRLGKDRLAEYLRRFGFGRPTALRLPHEEAGLLPDPDDPSEWSGSSIGTIPIGHGISVTAMQMLLAYNTIANDGVYVPPTLLRATFDAEGQRHDVAPGEGQRVVSPATAAEVRAMLAEAVATGTGRAAAIDNYDVAGKTGTARKPQPGGGYRDAAGNYHHVATFAGFIPADDPRVSIIVVIDEPTTSAYAGTVAAPAFAEIGRRALRTLGIAPPAAAALGAAPPLDGDRVRADPAAPPTTATTATTAPVATTTTTAAAATVATGGPTGADRAAPDSTPVPAGGG